MGGGFRGQQRRDVQGGDAGVGASLGRGVEASATLLGTQLAMPYYSFGTQFGRITKE